MCHGGTCSSGSQCGTAGICEKIQDLYRPAGISDLRSEPVPVYCLFGKQTCVFEAERLQMKRQGFADGFTVIMDIPLLGKIKELPFSAAFFAAVIMTVLFFPATQRFGGIPDDLWVRTNQKVVPPSLQFFSAGGVQNFVFLPAICCPHNNMFSCFYCRIGHPSMIVQVRYRSDLFTLVFIV